jgi:hypothetical protein
VRASVYAWRAGRRLAGRHVQNVFSDNGRYFVRILPGQSIGDSVGFSGAPVLSSSRIPPLIVAAGVLLVWLIG